MSCDVFEVFSFEHRIDGRPLEELSKKELINVVKSLDIRWRITFAELQATKVTMNKFLESRQDQELSGVLKHVGDS